MEVDRRNFWILPQHTWNCSLIAYYLAKHSFFKMISSETSKLNTNLDKLKECFINCGYKENFLIDQFSRISNVTRKALFTWKPKITNKPKISLVLKFDKTLPNIKEKIDTHKHFLQIIPLLKKMHFKRD